MREILFRGQTRRKGERVRISGEPIDSNWVYGGIFPGKGDFSIIYQTKPEIEKFTVYSDTVGQYTGLTDKNGTKIFEGDIVRGDSKYFTYNHPYGTIVYDGGEFLIAFDEALEDVENLGAWANDIEVIGNIHDNPELLGE